MILFPKNHIILSELVFRKFFDRKTGCGSVLVPVWLGYRRPTPKPVRSGFPTWCPVSNIVISHLAFFHLLGLENEQLILIWIKDRVTTDIYWNKAAFGFSLKPVYKKRNYDFDIFMTDNPFLKWASYPYGTITESVINLVRLRLYFMNNCSANQIEPFWRPKF